MNRNVNQAVRDAGQRVGQSIRDQFPPPAGAPVPGSPQPGSGAPGTSIPNTEPPTYMPAEPGTGPGSGTTQGNSSAFATIRQMLDSFGLGSLADWAWRRFQEGASIDVIMVEMYQRPEFKAVYPEYEVLAKRGRAYSVAELQAWRKQAVGLMHQYGIPSGFYDSPDDLYQLAVNEVSLGELSRRLAGAAEAVYQASPLMRAEMERLYGVGQGELIAYWLDPNKAEPLIRQRWISAQIGGASRQTGYGTLTVDEAERLAGLGVDAARAAQGFSELAQSEELFGTLNQAEQVIGRDTQLGAAFGGDADAIQTVERRRDRRRAEFAGGGGYATSNEGIVGV